MVETDSIVLNTSRPLFRKASVRRAVAYAIDREALLHAIGFLPGKVTDQILPPAIPGYRNVKIYPFKADVQTAKKLMGTVERPLFSTSPTTLATFRSPRCSFEISRASTST